VLYDDPVEGYPTTYPRDHIPEISSYPAGQTAPSPHAIDFVPGHLLGSVSGELALRSFLESAGHTLVVTSDKDGEGSTFDRELVDADVVISQPFGPPTSRRVASPRRRTSSLRLLQESALTTPTPRPQSIGAFR
jgi:formate dehydrogenase